MGVQTVILRWLRPALWLLLSAAAGASSVLLHQLLLPPTWEATARVHMVGSVDGAARSAQIKAFTDPDLLRSVVHDQGLHVTASQRYLPGPGRALARLNARTGVLGDAFLGLERFGWGRERAEVSAISLPERLRAGPLTLELLPGERVGLYGPDGRLILSGPVGETARTDERDPDTLEPSVTIRVDRADAPVGATFQLKIRPVEALSDELARRLEVREAAEDRLTIRLVAADPEAAAATLRALIQERGRRMQARRPQGARGVLDFLEQRIEAVTTDARAAAAALDSAQRVAPDVMLRAGPRRSLDRLVEVELEIAQLLERRRELQRDHDPGDPVIQNIDVQVAAWLDRIDELGSRIDSYYPEEQERIALERDARVTASLLAELERRHRETQAALGSTVEALELEGSVETQPVGGAASSVGPIAYGAGAGAMLALLVILSRRRWWGTIDSSDELERAVGVEVLGAVPHSRRQRELFGGPALISSRLLAREAPSEPAVEALRSLRIGLRLLRPGREGRVLMFTGPGPGVGKSFVSANLAQLMVEAGERVVLVDADLRRGRLHHYFGRARATGMSELLAGTASLEDVLITDAAGSFAFIGAGSPPPNPAAVLASEALPAVIAALCDRFDRVILDTPPVLAAADAELLGSRAGTVLLVLRAGRHPRGEIEEAIRRLRRAGVAIEGAVFNDEMERGSYAAYYHPYSAGGDA